MIGAELSAFLLFKGLETADLDQIAWAMQPRSLAKGDILFHQDEPGETMFLVRSGRLRIFIRDEQQHEITFRYYGPGEIVGEFALLDDKPRSASADAVEATQLMALSRLEFDKFLRERPIIGITMMRSLAERVRYTTTYLEKMLNAVELLSNQNYEQALREMAISSDESSIQGMIQAFVQMVGSVRERERSLRRVAVRSKVDIDKTDTP